MRTLKFVGWSPVAVAAAVGLGRYAYAQQYPYMGTNPVTLPFVGSDGTNANNQLTYTSLLIQTIQEATTPRGNFQSAGTPYIVGTVRTTPIGTSSFSSSQTTTAFIYGPAGFRLVGQYDPATTEMYRNSGNTTNFNGIPNQQLYFHSGNVSGVNGAGQMIAYEGIEAPDSTANSVLGRHGYLYNYATNSYVPMGLTGSGFTALITYNNTSSVTVTAPFQTSTPSNIDALGNVSGTSLRYYNGSTPIASSTATLGTSAFMYNGTTNVETGLFGSNTIDPTKNYTYTKAFSDGGTGRFSTNSDRGVNGGFSAGTASVFVEIGDFQGHQTGTDGWVYSKATNTSTPLGGYISGITPTVAGSALSYSYGYSQSFTNTTTSTTVSGVNRSTSIQALNSAGQIGFTSTLYQAASGSLSKGTDSYVFTPGANTYKQVGLISNGFNTSGTSSFVSTAGARTSTISYLNAGGASVGTSTQYVSAVAGGTGANTSNSVAWFAPATGPTIQIGFTDAYHTGATAGYTYVASSVSQLTDTGLVGGTSNRFAPGTNTSLGADPWVYDSVSGTLYDLDPFANTPTNYFSGSITYLSESGYAVGQYKTSAAATALNQFVWSPAGGFLDLNSNTSLAGTGYSSLLQAFSTDPTGTSIYAFGGVGSNTGTQQGVVILNPSIPEPATLSIVGMLATTALSRRRRVG